MKHIKQKRGPGNISPAAHYFPAMLDYYIGKWRRRQGKYDKCTLARLRRAWRRQPSLKHLLGYLAFRRDLGFLPSPVLTRELAGHLHNLPRYALQPVANLLCECGMAVRVRESLGPRNLRDVAACSPLVAELAQQKGLELENNSLALAKLQAAQEQTRRLFTDFLDRHRGSICVVGNAAGLSGAELGEQIDAHEIVVRFNRYRSAASRDVDTGLRTDVWVRAPDLYGIESPDNPAAEWIVLSGPDIRYQLADWAPLIPHIEAGRRMLTVPLTTWRALVRELHAPPSAGILMLAWIIELTNGTAEITATGFQSTDSPITLRQPYHHALPRQRPGHRHNWAGERALLTRWTAAGQVLTDAR